MSFFTDEDRQHREQSLKTQQQEWVNLIEELSGTSVGHHADYILQVAKQQYRKGLNKVQVTIPLCWEPLSSASLESHPFDFDAIISEYEIREEIRVARNSLIAEEAERDLYRLIANQFNLPFEFQVFKARVIGTMDGIDIIPPRVEFRAILPDYKDPYIEYHSLPDTQTDL